MQVLKALILYPVANYYYKYIHSLLLNTGILTHDPDTYNKGEAMTEPYREELLEDMGKDISELEIHNTWNIIDRKSLPEGENILPSTWAFKIPEGDRSFYGLVQNLLYWFNTLKQALNNLIAKLEKDGFDLTKEKDLFHYLGVEIAKGAKGNLPQRKLLQEIE